MHSLSWDTRSLARYDSESPVPPGGWTIINLIEADVVEDALAENYSYVEPFHEWWDFIYDDWKTELATYGITDVDISFSGFWSQGDGASFTGNVDVETYIRRRGLAQEYADVLRVMGAPFDCYVTCVLKRNSSRYSHSGTVDAILDEDTGYAKDLIEEAGIDFVSLGENLAFLEKDIDEFQTDKSHEIYRQLEKEYEYLTSAEHFIEEAKANDLRFDENLKIIH